MQSTVSTASAPGKLFLFGEYGVLAGGWCVVAAVDRRVLAHRRSEPAGYEVLGADLSDPSALPRAVLAELDHETDSDIDRLSADVRRLFDETTGEKLGLGSSAASTVALTAASLSDGSLTAQDRRLIFEHAFGAHRRLQGGRGSGADIAAASFGGIVAYRLVRPMEPFGACATSADIAAEVSTDEAHVRLAVPLPPELRIEPLWLGSPARSTSFVRRCEQAFESAPDETQRALCRTSAIAEEALSAIDTGRPGRVVELARQADQALERLGELIEAPIVTEAHRALRERARAHAIAVKPSGAGGGDFSLAIGPAEASWEPFLRDLPGGVRHIPLALGAEGVSQERDR